MQLAIAVQFQNSIEQQFNFFDKNSEEAITFNSLKKTCIDLGMSFTDSQLKGMIGTADTDGDGKVSRDEFTTIMTKSYFKSDKFN